MVSKFLTGVEFGIWGQLRVGVVSKAFAYAVFAFAALPVSVQVYASCFRLLTRCAFFGDEVV